MTPRPTRVIATVAIVDLTTKLALTTPTEVEHHLGRSTVALLLTVAAVNLTLGHRWQRIRVATSLVAAGALCNAVDLLDGTGQNPFVVVLGPGATGGVDAAGFNFADCAAIAGLAAILAHAVRDLTRHLKETTQP